MILSVDFKKILQNGEIDENTVNMMRNAREDDYEIHIVSNKNWKFLTDFLESNKIPFDKISKSFPYESEIIITNKTNSFYVENDSVNFDTIITSVATVTGFMPNTEYQGRKREFVFSRQLAHYFARKYTKMSLSKIGAKIGGLDHSSVIYSCKAINNFLSLNDRITVDYVTKIENLIQQ